MILKESEGAATPKKTTSLLKAMTTFNRVNTVTQKVSTAVLCAGLIGATTCALAPAAEARNYEQQRRHELRQLRREIAAIRVTTVVLDARITERSIAIHA